MKRICLKGDDKECNLDPLRGINPYLNPDIQYRAVFESGYLKLDLYNVDIHSYLIRHIYLTLFVPNLNPRKKQFSIFVSVDIHIIRSVYTV